MSFETLITGDDGFNGLVHGRHGYFVFNRNDIYIGRSLKEYGEFSQLEFDLLNQLAVAGDFVIEVGANIGSHTVGLAKKVGINGRVVAFEPQRVVHQNLCANISINSLANVECHQLAVGATAGNVLIPEIRYDVEGNFGGVDVRQFETGKEVQRVTIDEFCDLPRLRLVKIDVEGMEHDVITGAKNTIQKHRPVLYVENDRAEESPALISLLQGMSYTMYWHIPPMFNPNNYARNQTNHFGGIASFNMLCIPTEHNADIQGLKKIDDPDEHPLKTVSN